MTRSQCRHEDIERAYSTIREPGASAASIRQALSRLWEEGWLAGRPPRGRGLHTIQVSPEERAAMARALHAPFGAGTKPVPPRKAPSPKPSAAAPPRPAPPTPAPPRPPAPAPSAPTPYVPGVVTPPAHVPTPAAEARSKSLPPSKPGDPW